MSSVCDEKGVTSETMQTRAFDDSFRSKGQNISDYCLSRLAVAKGLKGGYLLVAQSDRIPAR